MELCGGAVWWFGLVLGPRSRVGNWIPLRLLVWWYGFGYGAVVMVRLCIWSCCGGSSLIMEWGCVVARPCLWSLDSGAVSWHDLAFGTDLECGALIVELCRGTTLLLELTLNVELCRGTT